MRCGTIEAVENDVPPLRHPRFALGDGGGGGGTVAGVVDGSRELSPSNADEANSRLANTARTLRRRSTVHNRYAANHDVLHLVCSADLRQWAIKSATANADGSRPANGDTCGLTSSI